MFVCHFFHQMKILSQRKQEVIGTYITGFYSNATFKNVANQMTEQILIFYTTVNFQ